MTVPHEPLMKVYGVLPEKCFVFKSAVQPMKMTFMSRTFPADWKKGDEEPELKNYSLVLKNGDDLRQDQLILQMITLMDVLLKEVNYDFKFTAYRCLATSKSDGLMEFVEGSKTI